MSTENIELIKELRKRAEEIGQEWSDHTMLLLAADNIEENAKLREQPGDGTTGNKYRAELYDEVWNLAKSMGFANVTDALGEIVKLREQLAEAESVKSSYDSALIKALKRAEAAEAKNEAASAQEPVGYVTPSVLADLKKGVRYGGARITARIDDEDGCTSAIYAEPVPPVDVQELRAHIIELQNALAVRQTWVTYYSKKADMRLHSDNCPVLEAAAFDSLGNTCNCGADSSGRIAELERDLNTIAAQRDDLMKDNLSMVERIAELERKLAEQQAFMQSIVDADNLGVNDCIIVDRFIVRNKGDEKKELNTIIAKAREEGANSACLDLEEAALTKSYREGIEYGKELGRKDALSTVTDSTPCAIVRLTLSVDDKHWCYNISNNRLSHDVRNPADVIGDAAKWGYQLLTDQYISED